MKKVLKRLYILQEVINKDKKLGRGFTTALRINPWNPLSYISLLLILIIGIVMFGVYGFWKEVDLRNPFDWD